MREPHSIKSGKVHDSDLIHSIVYDKIDELMNKHLANAKNLVIHEAGLGLKTVMERTFSLKPKTEQGIFKILRKHDKKISVLIKNNSTRKTIKEDLTKLKKKSILDIKNYLRKHNLIKVGSSAPNDVLREIYEQSILAGDINNKNNNNFLVNNL